jgi:hypothetical protein
MRISLFQGSSPRVPEGWRLINSEVAFLKSALSSDKLIIAGDIYSWAKQFYEARDIIFEIKRQPEEELSDACTGLSASQATALFNRLGETAFDALERPLQLTDIAQAIWGDYWWHDPLNATHAAQWAFLQLEQSPSPVEAVLLKVLAAEFQLNSHAREKAVYDALNSKMAFKVLRTWLENKPKDWQTFPLEISQILRDQLQSAYRAEAVLERGLLFARLQKSNADPRVLYLAAESCAVYFQQNPSKLSKEIFQTLSKFIQPEMRRKLEEFLPVPAPSPLPEATENWQAWFVGEYLPFRSRRPADDPEVHQIARAFAETYLERYAKALTGSSDQAFLSFSKTREMPNSNSVTLFVVLDGLSYPDMQLLWEKLYLLDAPKRLSLARAELVFAPVPTITEVAKLALLTGSRPAMAVEKNRLVLGFRSSKDDEVRSALLSAKHGEVVIWSLLDTDKVYHGAQSNEVGAYNAEGVLQSLANRLLGLVNAVADHSRLQVIISTDHGRLRSSSQREIAAPNGLRPHGRAALGNLVRDFPDSGFLIEGDVALLNATRFGLSEDAAVVLSDASFLTSDGRSGTEIQPHGGLYPEEVLIPYWTLQRDAQLLPLAAQIEGTGQAGKVSQVVLSIGNPNVLEITILRLQINLGYNFTKEMKHSILPMSNSSLEILFDNFPTQKHLENASGQVWYENPSGEMLSAEVTLLLSSQELYQQDNILEGLL